jgi:hypothetical protein
MTINGIDKYSNCLNDYGKKVDNLLGSFNLIKYKIYYNNSYLTFLSLVVTMY